MKEHEIQKELREQLFFDENTCMKYVIYYSKNTFDRIDESVKQAYTDENLKQGEFAVRLAFATIDCDRLHASC
ncbi:MAG TPA: hypothetical protein PKA81_08295 [Clostridia bacterium]|nr:hypothetical protein [Clostridia bacterium]